MSDLVEQFKAVAAQQKPAVALKKAEISLLEKVIAAVPTDADFTRNKYWVPFSHAYGGTLHRNNSSEQYKLFQQEQVISGFAFLLGMPYEPVRGVYRELRNGLKRLNLHRKVSVYHRMLRKVFFDDGLDSVNCQLDAYRDALTTLNIPRMIDAEKVLDDLTTGLLVRFNLNMTPASYASMLIRQKHRALGELLESARIELSLHREKGMEAYLGRAEELVKTKVLEAAGVGTADPTSYKQVENEIRTIRTDFASRSVWATREV